MLGILLFFAEMKKAPISAANRRSICLTGFGLRRVVSATIPRVAAANSLDSFECSPNRAILFDSFKHVGAARWLEAADVWQKWADALFVEKYQRNQEPRENAGQTLTQNLKEASHHDNRTFTPFEARYSFISRIVNVP